MPLKLLLSCASIILLTFSYLHSQIFIHGHRGTRGWAPENSIQAFKEACLQQADYLELDIVVTSDNQLLINHEPYLNKRFQRKGIKIVKNKKFFFNSDTFGETDQKKFPFQQKSPCIMPTMSEVVAEIEKFCLEKHIQMPFWNIEMKSVPFHNKYYPNRKIYAKILIDELNRLNLREKGFIQSFDIKLLQEMYAIDSTWKYAWLLLKPRKVEKRLDKANIKIFALNPNGSLLKKSFVDDAQKSGIQVIPWTINSPRVIKKMMNMQVNGIITDYPLRVKLLQTEINDDILEITQSLQSAKNEDWIQNWTKLECLNAKKIEKLSSDEKLHFWTQVFMIASAKMQENQKQIYTKSKFYIGGKSVSLEKIEKKYILVKKNDKNDTFQPDSTQINYVFLWFLQKFPQEKIHNMNEWIKNIYQEWTQQNAKYVEIEHKIILPQKSKILFKYISKEKFILLIMKYLPISSNKKILPRIGFSK